MTWILSVVSLLTVYLTGKKKIIGWQVGLIGQALWISWEFYIKAWGLMPMTVIMTILYVKNLKEWKKEKLES